MFLLEGPKFKKRGALEESYNLFVFCGYLIRHVVRFLFPMKNRYVHQSICSHIPFFGEKLGICICTCAAEVGNFQKQTLNSLE